MASPFDSLMASLAPTAWWKLADSSGSTSAVDSSGNGYSATVEGSVTFGEASTPIAGGGTTCQINGGSYGQNGLLSALTVPSATTELTANIWAYVPSWSSANYYPGVLTNALTSVADEGFGITLTLASGGSNMQFAIGNGSAYVDGQYGYPSAAAWHMFTLVYSGGNLYSYMDGVSLGAAVAVTPSWGSNPVAIGYEPTNGGDFVSYLAEAAVWVGTALTATQIADLHQAAAGWAEVQVSSAFDQNSPASCSFVSNVTDGNVLVTIVESVNPASVTISDTLSNIWIPAAYFVATDFFSQQTVIAAWWCVSQASGADTVTVAVTDGTYNEIYIGEFDPPVASVGQDGTAGTFETATGTGQTTSQAASGTSATVDLLIGYLFAAGGQSGAASAPWASIGGSQNGDQGYYSINQVGSTASNFTMSGNTGYAVMVAALQSPAPPTLSAQYAQSYGGV